MDTTQPGTEYGGPSVLSRGGIASLRTPPQAVRIRPFLSLTANYDTGITPLSLTPTGQVPNDASFGAEAEAGLLGYHRWRGATLGIDYRGSYRHYTKNTFYNGTDQALTLVYTKKATRRLDLTLRESAGLFARNFYTPDSALIDPSFSDTPTNELFDGRTQYLSTKADLTYKKTARLSFNFAGDGFLVRRRSSALYGVTGYRARTDVAYRTSRFATTGAAYDFTHFEFTKGFGGSDIHTVTLTQAFRFGRSWELSMKAGGARVETLGLARVAIDPVIAEIIGRSVGIAAIYRINWVPAAAASLTRNFHHAVLTFTYERGVTPGNGLYLTSRTESGGAGFSYTGIRKWNLGVTGSYGTYQSLTQDLGQYTGYNVGGGVTYNLTKSLHFISRYDYRYYDVGSTSFQRNTSRASIGLSFSPGDVPLALW